MDGWKVIRQKVWFWPTWGFLHIRAPSCIKRVRLVQSTHHQQRSCCHERLFCMLCARLKEDDFTPRSRSIQQHALFGTNEGCFRHLRYSMGGEYGGIHTDAADPSILHRDVWGYRMWSAPREIPLLGWMGHWIQISMQLAAIVDGKIWFYHCFVHHCAGTWLFGRSDKVNPGKFAWFVWCCWESTSGQRAPTVCTKFRWFSVFQAVFCLCYWARGSHWRAAKHAACGWAAAAQGERGKWWPVRILEAECVLAVHRPLAGFDWKSLWQIGDTVHLMAGLVPSVIALREDVSLQDALELYSDDLPSPFNAHEELVQQG